MNLSPLLKHVFDPILIHRPKERPMHDQELEPINELCKQLSIRINQRQFGKTSAAVSLAKLKNGLILTHNTMSAETLVKDHHALAKSIWHFKAEDAFVTPIVIDQDAALGVMRRLLQILDSRAEKLAEAAKEIVELKKEVYSKERIDREAYDALRRENYVLRQQVSNLIDDGDTESDVVDADYRADDLTHVLDTACEKLAQLLFDKIMEDNEQ